MARRLARESLWSWYICERAVNSNSMGMPALLEQM
jgi:hypothetical protein